MTPNSSRYLVQWVFEARSWSAIGSPQCWQTRPSAKVFAGPLVVLIVLRFIFVVFIVNDVLAIIGYPLTCFAVSFG
jgi:hypothetical protein